MYIDTIVVAGVAAVLLTIAFAGGFFWFIYKDAHKNDKK